MRELRNLVIMHGWKEILRALLQIAKEDRQRKPLDPWHGNPPKGITS